MLLSDYNHPDDCDCYDCQEAYVPDHLTPDNPIDDVGWCDGCERPIALADPGHPYGGHAAQCEFNPNPPMNSDDYDPSVWD